MDYDDPSEAAKEQDREQQKAAKQARRDWRSVLSTAAGRRVLGEIAHEWCGALAQPAPGQSEYRNGQRAIGLRILEEAARYDGDAAMEIVAGGMTIGGPAGGRRDRGEDGDGD